MNYKLYTTSIQAWDAMLLAIDLARKSIFLEMYIFLDDTDKSHDFIGKLIKKAGEGLRVVIVADAFGSKSIKKETLTAMKDAGVEFIYFSHWLRHVHRKVLIIDERVAFMGGVNIGKRFAYWNDLQLKLRGRIVKRLLKSFAYTYEMAGGQDAKILNHKNKRLGFKLKYWLVEHWPIKNVYSMKNHYIKKITRAEKSVQIVTPYFTPPRWLISLLDDAVRRGVEVEILIPKQVDWKIMNYLNYHYMHRMCPMGINFYLTHEMNHAKLLIIDGREGLLGSQNVDALSFSINSEVGIFFTEKKLIQELLYVIGIWKQHSDVVELRQYKMRMVDYLILAFLKLLRPIL